MELQADLGDRAGAVSTYHRCASVLERELGVTPGPSIRQAFRRLMADARPAARPRGTHPAAGRPGPGRPSFSAGPLSSACCTRHGGPPRRGAVVSCWSAGALGWGRPAWSPRWLTTARQQGAVVAVAQCFGAAGRLALAPVAEWLRSDAVQSAMAALDPAWRAEVSRLMPAGPPRGRRAGDGGCLATSPLLRRARPGAARRRAPAAAGLGQHAVVRPGDAGLHHVLPGARRGGQVLVAATVREDNVEEDPELSGWIVRMRASGLLTELSLSPLEAADTAQLAEAISGQRLPETDAELLHAATGGFPLYIIEAIRGTAGAGGTPLPVGDLAAVLRKRLDQGTAAAREVAALAAAVGTNFTLDLLTEASDLDAGLVVAAVDELWRRRIVRVFGDGYDFSHDLLRESAYAGISPPKRWLLHRRIAQGLELLHAEDADPSRPSSPSNTRGPGGPSARSPTTSGPPISPPGCSPTPRPSGCTTRRSRSSPALAPGRDRDARELAVLEAMAAPLNASKGYSSPDLQHTLERTIMLAGVAGPQGLDRGRHDRAVGHAARARAHGRQPPDGHPGPGPRRPLLAAVRPGSFRRRRFGHQPGHARRGAAAPGPGREDGRRCRLAQRRHPLRRARHGLGRACPLAARPGRRRRAGLPRGHQAGPGHRRPLQPGGGPGLRRHHPPDASRPARAEEHRRRAAPAVRPA